LCPPFCEIRAGYAGFKVFSIFYSLREGDYPVCVRIGKRAEKDRVNYVKTAALTAIPRASVRMMAGRKSRIPAQHPHSVSNILQQLLKCNYGPDFPCLFLNLLDIAKLPESCITCFLRRHSPLDIVKSFPLDVVANVLIELLKQVFPPGH
jgi:hypothetical protein